MSYASIRAALADVLEGVSGIGPVHQYDRWAIRWEKTLELFKTDEDLFHAWMISRKAVAQRQATLGEIERAHVLTIRGVYGLKDADATEQTFQDLIEAVINALSDPDNDTLDGTCSTTHPDWGPMNGACGPQVDSIDVRMFGSVLCHIVEMRLCAVETITA